MIEIKLSLLKDERGTHEGYVTVHRKNGLTFQRKQRLGHKSKIELLPDEICKEILYLRSIGDSGTKIKEIIENGITENKNGKFVYTKIDLDKKKKLASQEKILNKKYLNTSNPEEKEKIINQLRIIKKQYTKEIQIPDNAPIKNGKLTIVPQSLVAWAKIKGIETRNKRQPKVIDNPETLNQLKRLEEKNARLEIQLKDLKNSLDAEKKARKYAEERMMQLKLENYKLKHKS